MIDEASKAGVSAVKFQFHVLEDEMLKQTPKSSNFKDSLYETLKRTNLSISEHRFLKKYCERKNRLFGTPFSFKSADILEKDIKLKVFKVDQVNLQIYLCKYT